MVGDGRGELTHLWREQLRVHVPDERVHEHGHLHAHTGANDAGVAQAGHRLAEGHVVIKDADLVEGLERLGDDLFHAA